MALPDPDTEKSSRGAGAALADFTRHISIELAAKSPELPSFPEVALRVRQR